MAHASKSKIDKIEHPPAHYKTPEYWRKASLTTPRGANAIGMNYHNPHFLNWLNRT